MTYGFRHHRCETPMADAPPYALELYAMGIIIIEGIATMSVTLDRATASLEKLNNAATAIENVLDMVVAEVKSTGTDDPKVLAALDAIDAKSDEIVAKALANTPAASQVPSPAAPTS